MEITLEVAKSVWHIKENVVVRLLVLNNSYEPVSMDRRLLIGPNVVLDGSRGNSLPVSVEPTFTEDEQNLIILNPWCLYGRQRSFDNLPVGNVTLHGYLLKQRTDALLPRGPQEADALLVSATPVVLSIIDS